LRPKGQRCYKNLLRPKGDYFPPPNPTGLNTPFLRKEEGKKIKGLLVNGKELAPKKVLKGIMKENLKGPVIKKEMRCQRLKPSNSQLRGAF